MVTRKEWGQGKALQLFAFDNAANGSFAQSRVEPQTERRVAVDAAFRCGSRRQRDRHRLRRIRETCWKWTATRPSSTTSTTVPAKRKERENQEKMEKVILRTSQLNQLGLSSPPRWQPRSTVRSPCDGLPAEPDVSRPQAYIVNTDPAGQPGQHWFGRVGPRGMRARCLTVLPWILRLTGRRNLWETWLRRHYKYVTKNGQSVQSLHNQSCGRTRLDVSGGQIARAESCRVSSARGPFTITWPTTIAWDSGSKT